MGILGVRLQNSYSPKQEYAMEHQFPDDVASGQVRYISILGDDITIPKEGWGDIYARREDFSYCVDDLTDDKKKRTCIDNYYGNPDAGFATVGIGGTIWKPTDYGQLSGQKMYVSVAFITGLTDFGFPIGAIVINDDYNPDFSPQAYTPDFQASLACKMLVWEGTDKSEINCRDFGYLPYTNKVIQGPSIINGAGYYIVEGCSNGIWVKPYSEMQPGALDGLSQKTLESIVEMFGQITAPAPASTP